MAHDAPMSSSRGVSNAQTFDQTVAFMTADSQNATRLATAI